MQGQPIRLPVVDLRQGEGVVKVSEILELLPSKDLPTGTINSILKQAGFLT
jgi:hypothetical protein